MKPRILVPLSVAGAALSGIILIAGAATAAIPSTRSPYPSVTINPNACRAEAIKVRQAIINYNRALANFQQVVPLLPGRIVSAEEGRTLQAAVDNAGIALTDARYAEATCQNNAANPANRNCVNLALELNRLIDNLRYTQDLESIAASNWQMAQELSRTRGAITAQDYRAYRDLYLLAQQQTKLVNQQIADQRKAITTAGGRDADRPTPTSTTTTTPSTCTAATPRGLAATETSTEPDPVLNTCTPPEWTDPCPAIPDIFTDTPTVTEVPTPTDVTTWADSCVPPPTETTDPATPTNPVTPTGPVTPTSSAVPSP